MGYLEDTSGALPDASQAVISFWFRVPQESIEACAASYNPDVNVKFNGVIPLFVFGKVYRNKKSFSPTPTGEAATYTHNRWTNDFSGGFCNFAPSTSTTETLPFFSAQEVGDPFDLIPSYIGLDCTQEPPVLTLNLQTATDSELEGFFYVRSGATIGTLDELDQLSTMFDRFGPGAIECSNIELRTITGTSTPTYVLRGYEWEQTITELDISKQIFSPFAETFGSRSKVSPAADTWHHMLLSFDLGGEVTAVGNHNGAGRTLSTTCKLWMAVDDVNIVGDDLPRPHTYAPGLVGDNDFVPQMAWIAYLSDFGDPPSGVSTILGAVQNVTYTNPQVTPHYHINEAVLPLASEPFGLPSTSEFAERIYKIEMAELQVYTGVSIDTGEEKMRRLFIDDRGQPVGASAQDYGRKKAYATALVNDALDSARKANMHLDLEGSAANISALVEAYGASLQPSLKAAKVLGKKPDLMLHGATRWIGGDNTGTADTDIQGTGTITPYKPDPQIDKKSG